MARRRDSRAVQHSVAPFLTDSPCAHGAETRQVLRMGAGSQSRIVSLNDLARREPRQTLFGAEPRLQRLFGRGKRRRVAYRQFKFRTFFRQCLKLLECVVPADGYFLGYTGKHRALRKPARTRN